MTEQKTLFEPRYELIQHRRKRGQKADMREKIAALIDAYQPVEKRKNLTAYTRRCPPGLQPKSARDLGVPPHHIAY
jgi:hypothetical protein